MDIRKQRRLLSDSSEKLINELEKIYSSGPYPWRSDPVKVEKEAEIKKQLADIFAEADRLPAH